MNATEKCVILEHPKLPNITVTFEEIGPDKAAEYLLLNAEAQRLVSQATVDRYSGDMASLQWLFNGATVLFDKQGRLIDGQHRLKAIVESGETQVILICRGLDPSVMMAIDAGRRRNFADSLRIQGVVNHRLAAAITGRYWFWEHGTYGTRGQSRGLDDTYLHATPSNAQLHSMWPKVEAELGVTIAHAAEQAARLFRACPGFSAGTYGLAWLILSGIDKDLREMFWSELIDEPKDPAADYPINCFVRTLARRDLGKDNWTHVQQLHHFFTVYNRWVTGEKLSFLRMPQLVRPGNLAVPIKITQPALSTN